MAKHLIRSRLGFRVAGVLTAMIVCTSMVFAAAHHFARLNF